VQKGIKKPQKYIKKAQKYLEWGKPNQAIAELSPVLKYGNIGQKYRWLPNHMMGIALLLKGEHEASAAYFEKAIKQGSIEPETYHMLSVDYFNMGRFEEAEKLGNEAVTRKDDFLKAWLNLGSVYRSQAKLDQALLCYKKVNELDPRNAGVAFRVGELYRDQGDWDQALKLFDITLKVDDSFKLALLEKADILKKKTKFKKAESCLIEARDRFGDSEDIKVSLAELYKDMGNYDQAIEIYKNMFVIHPDNGLLRMNYASCLNELCRFDESETQYRRAIRDMPDSQEPISTYLMALHYNPKNTREYIFEEHLRLVKNFMESDPPVRPIPGNINRTKKLKLGFVSGGFRGHPVGYMIAGALEQLPDDLFDIYCYTTNNIFDYLSRRIHKNIDVWRSVVGYNTKVLSNIIRDDEIDILVDLSGHAEDTRLKVMAQEPAPIIVKWVGGLFNTTGMECFDFLISDTCESPNGVEKFYTEKLVRMPDDYIVYTPPAFAPDVDTLPAEKNGYVTFGCFNNPTKVNEEVLKQWAIIMHSVPGSHLLLKSKQYDTVSLRNQIISLMQDHGINKNRIEFRGQTIHAEHLGDFNRVDISLDPWPYSGGLTTCESLYMGVPVITLPGPTFAGRHSTTHLSNAGLEHWVTDSWEEYRDKAISLAKNRDELKEWRNKLRKQLLTSPVCDGKRFGAHLAVAFRRMWEQRVAGYENESAEWQDHITVEPLTDEKVLELTDGPLVTPPITIKDETNQKVIQQESMDEPMKDTGELWPDVTSNKNLIDGKKNDYSKTSRGKNEDVYIETRDGVIICTPSDFDVLTTFVLLEQKQWFEPELEFLREYIRQGMQVIDAGACFGAYALPLAKKVGEKGKVIAFEPSADSRSYLEKSKIENGFEQLEVIGRGLSDSTAKAKLKRAQSPELNAISEDGEEAIALTTIDAWWDFAGQPEIDVIKVDVNGLETNVLAGGAEMLANTNPVIVASIGENEESLKRLRDQLNRIGYKLYEYIPGPSLLAEHDPEAGVDAYLMNVVAIPESRVEEFKQNGWIFDESVKIETVDSNKWKEVLVTQPWAGSLIDDWEKNISAGNYEQYVQALNLACAAEQIKVSADDPMSRSRKGAVMLAAAQKLTDLFNSGDAGIPAALTYVRIMSRLGKQYEAVKMAKQLMETVNSKGEVSADIPFLPPLPEQDRTFVGTGFSNWLTIRIVEAWLSLKNPTMYIVEENDKQMLDALTGNPEVINRFKNLTDLRSESEKNGRDVNQKASKPKSTFIHLCFNHVYAKTLSDLIEYTNANSDQEHWLLIEKHRAIPSYSADISDNPHSTFFDFQSQLEEVLQECLKPKVDAVFMHGLFFDWQKNLVSRVGDKKHIAWKFWGGDLYNPIKQGRPLYDLISKVDSVHGKVEGDFEIIENTYGKKHKYRFGYTFPGLYGDWPKEIEKETPPIITVGNSGDSSNNHKKILEILASKKDINDFRLHLPVAYNLTHTYRNELIQTIRDLGLSDNTLIQESFIPPKEYMQLIMRGSMLIVAHNRQQALGSILASIYSGNNTFVKKKILMAEKEIRNPTWRFIEDYNLQAQPFEDLLKVDYLSDIPVIDKNVMKRHQELIKTQIGLEARSRELVKACDQIVIEI